MRVTAYRDLGPRGDHAAPIWQRQINSSFKPRADFDRNTKYPFGSQRLHDLWDKAKELAKLREKELSMLGALQRLKVEAVDQETCGHQDTAEEHFDVARTTYMLGNLQLLLCRSLRSQHILS